jgi:hypothetical protein
MNDFDEADPLAMTACAQHCRHRPETLSNP